MPWCGPTPDRPFPSLGWGVLRWTFHHLPSPSDETQPLIFTPEQARRIVLWYRIDPATGEFPYLRLVLEDAKGWGKSPMAAALAIAEFCGPVRFDGWDRRGEPIGAPWGVGGRRAPNFQIAAVSEDQTENTYGAMRQMLTANQGAAAAELGIDVGLTRLYLPERHGVLQPVTASAPSREGTPSTGAVLDETHLWRPSNGGVKLARTIRRNVAKGNARTIETTNAPALGENSVAEQSDPDQPAVGTLHFALRPREEPQPDWSDDQLMAALQESYGDVPWVDKPRLLREMRLPTSPWDDTLRFWFNWRTSSQARAVDARVWDRLADRREIEPGTRIGLGFDGSVSRDATALVGCTPDGYSFPIRIWERPEGASIDWRIPRQQVREAIEYAFERYDVGLMLADPPRWNTEIEDWATQFGKERVLAFDTNQARRMAPAVDRWLTGIREGTHKHSGSTALRRHVLAAHLARVHVTMDESDGRSLFVLVKGDDAAWIDAAVADVLAYQAAMTMPAPEAKRGGWAFAG